jgi:TolB-like protein
MHHPKFKKSIMISSPALFPHPFSRKAIEQQLDRILTDPLFAESKILKRFLGFVVNETLEGNSNRLKEYTIAVNVLDKPRDFKPQENGIVRIHAGRLRRALSHFYEETGAQDEIQISIPKGKYVPLISDKKDNHYNTEPRSKLGQIGKNPLLSDTVIVAVMPFLKLNKLPSTNSFADGLCFRLTESLMPIEQVSMISYQAMRSLCEKSSDFKDIASAVGANYIIAGSIEHLKNNIRVYTQIVDASTCMQLWSNLYERKLTNANLFKIEDEISSMVSSEFKSLSHFIKQDNIRPLGLAAI